jgi:hypothetical protein
MILFEKKIYKDLFCASNKNHKALRQEFRKPFFSHLNYLPQSPQRSQRLNKNNALGAQKESLNMFFYFSFIFSIILIKTTLCPLHCKRVISCFFNKFLVAASEPRYTTKV